MRVIFENVLKKPDLYVKSILEKGFEDFNDGPNVFKNVRERRIDGFHLFLSSRFPNHHIVLNFVRQSPHMQIEPNYIHSDEMMGDLTAVLYLNKKYPEGYGTSFYNSNLEKEFTYNASYNSAIVFSSDKLHSRNLEDNFGSGEDSRLVQVAFLKLKNK